MKHPTWLLVYSPETSVLAEKLNSHLDTHLLDTESSNLYDHLSRYRYNLLLIPSILDQGENPLTNQAKKKHKRPIVGYGAIQPKHIVYEEFINTIEAFENQSLMPMYLDLVIAKALRTNETPKRQS
jgi:hypothetical protein